MPEQTQIEKRIADLRRAFAEDGFEVMTVAWPDERTDHFGLIAKHRTAKSKGRDRKRAYYVEGSARDMGYLMGRLAEPLIQRMTEDYIENYVRKMAFVAAPAKWREKDWPLYSWLVDRVNRLTVPEKPIPALEPRREEIEGMVEGCLQANGDTEVTVERLWVLNLGIDYLFGLLYQGALKMAGTLFFKKAPAPSGCNALAVLNDAANDGSLFARDFMFPTCNVFQDCASLVIYNPLPRGDGRLPVVAMTAPGFVGSVAAMNDRGVAAGVDVVHGGHNRTDELGVNSLLLVRHAVEEAETIERAVERVWSTPRGVCWLYPMAGPSDRGVDRACIIEASASPKESEVGEDGELRYLNFPRKILHQRKLLPTSDFITAQRPPGCEYHGGVMIRWDDYEDPVTRHEYGRFNEGLWSITKWKSKSWKFVKDQFGSDGMINRSHKDARCPAGSYFAPLRAEPGKIVLASNHYVTPEMRLTTMGLVTTALDRHYANGSQWRYDELNRRVAAARWYDRGGTTRRDKPRSLSEEDVRELISFLQPECTDGRCPFVLPGNCFHYTHYHARACKRRWLQRRKGMEPVAIEGATSVFNLKHRTIDSHFGYYGDPWVKLHLPNYI